MILPSTHAIPAPSVDSIAVYLFSVKNNPTKPEQNPTMPDERFEMAVSRMVEFKGFENVRCCYMKLIRTEDAVGQVLCHDMTQIIKDQYKDARFRKGHVVTAEDIPVLLSMGKEHLYVWEMTPDMVHENDAAERLLALCGQENMTRSEVKEGKIELKAACDGLFTVDSARLLAVNSQDEVMIATRTRRHRRARGRQARGHARDPAHHRGEKSSGRRSRRRADAPLLVAARPMCARRRASSPPAARSKSGRIKDTFTPVVMDKLRAFGIETLEVGVLRRRGGERARARCSPCARRSRT